MLTQLRRVFLHEDYLVTRLPRSERVLGQYNDVRALGAHGINVDLGSYTGAPNIIATGAPVPADFAVIPLLVLRNYAGASVDWRANPEGPERAILQNRLQRFELDVLWEYALALVRIAAAEATQNERVPVWPSAVIAHLRTR